MQVTEEDHEIETLTQMTLKVTTSLMAATPRVSQLKTEAFLTSSSSRKTLNYNQAYRWLYRQAKPSEKSPTKMKLLYLSRCSCPRMTMRKLLTWPKTTYIKIIRTSSSTRIKLERWLLSRFKFPLSELVKSWRTRSFHWNPSSTNSR